MRFNTLGYTFKIMSKEQKFLLLVVLLVVGAGAVYYVKNTDSLSQTSGTSVQQVAQNVKSYTKDVTYPVPGDQVETIHVTVSLVDGVISDVAFSYNKPGNEESEEKIKHFEKALKSVSLTGKKLSEVSLSRVGGASLTTNAFMEAVTKIKTDING